LKKDIHPLYGAAMPTPQTAHGPLRSYGRLQSRPIRAQQAGRLTSLLPNIAVPQGPLDPQAMMPDAAEVWLEIGFGGGEHMAGQAAKRPDALVIGAEPFLNGVASALRHVDEGGLANVRIHHGDAREVIDALPDASLDRVFILFPDPWQKSRHHKRRLIQPDVIADLARVLKPGGTLRFATDWANYAEWTDERMAAATHVFREIGDRSTPADHLTTRYETKKLGDCAPVFLEYQRL
jgi:tRNA (guanine-N7-)-methyltransferase